VAQLPVVRVFCDMTLDKGGWTLVGRSAPEGKAPFGWSLEAGKLEELRLPYSLGVLGKPIAFTEIMVTDRGADGVHTHAYKFDAPKNLASHHTDSVGIAISTKVLGTCDPLLGPSAFKFAGIVDRDDSFFLRDIADVTNHTGLRASGFDTSYDTCDKGGAINKMQGEIYVR
jgi:hypothetical protein